MGLLTGVEIAGIAAFNLALIELDVVLGLVLFTDRHIANLLETEVDRVALPHLNTGPQNRVKRTGHVEVTDTTTGEAGGSGSRTLLVDQDDIAALTLAALLERHSQMVGRRHAVDAGTDHHILRAGGKWINIAQRNDRRVLHDAVNLFRHGAIHERIPLVLPAIVRKFHWRNLRPKCHIGNEQPTCCASGLQTG